MSDGNLDSKEGNKIKNWIKKNLATLDDKNKSKYKTRYNNAFKNAFEQSKKNQLSIEMIARKLKKLDMKDCEYKTIELAYQIIAADGVMEPNEMHTINHLIKTLNLDKDHVDKIRDQNILGLNQADLSENNLLATLGIDSTLNKKEIKQKLTIEFQKWNNRLNIVSVKDRPEVQTMLDRIALARKQYD